MENEMIREAMEEVAQEVIPATQEIAEEAIADVAQAITQEIPVIEPIPTIKAEPKKSGLKTVLLIASISTIVLFKPAKNAWNKHKENLAAKRRDEFNRWYDERRAAEEAAAQTAKEADNATEEQIEETNDAK